jgi:hypothetical protein
MCTQDEKEKMYKKNLMKTFFFLVFIFILELSLRRSDTCTCIHGYIAFFVRINKLEDSFLLLNEN